MTRQDVADTILRYGVSLDVKDWARLRSVFADDAVARFGDRAPLVGPDAIVEWIAAASSGVVYAHHQMNVAEVTLDGDTASALTYLTAYQTWDGRPGEATLLVGRYHHRLRREAAGWRITEKHLETGWRQTVGTMDGGEGG